MESNTNASQYTNTNANQYANQYPYANAIPIQYVTVNGGNDIHVNANPNQYPNLYLNVNVNGGSDIHVNVNPSQYANVNVNGGNDVHVNVNVDEKRCSKCKEYKSRASFYKNKKAKDGLQGYCIDCNRINMKKYQREKIYAVPEKYEIHKMRVSLSSRSSSKTKIEDLGCAKEELSAWLNYQRQITPEPIVKEELDHVLSVKYFDKYYPELCWFWVNFNPISQSINRHKSAKISWDLFKEQLDKSMDFLAINPSLELTNKWCATVVKYFGVYNKEVTATDLRNNFVTLNRNSLLLREQQVTNLGLDVEEITKIREQLEQLNFF